MSENSVKESQNNETGPAELNKAGVNSDSGSKSERAQRVAALKQAFFDEPAPPTIGSAPKAEGQTVPPSNVSGNRYT